MDGRTEHTYPYCSRVDIYIDAWLKLNDKEEAIYSSSIHEIKSQTKKCKAMGGRGTRNRSLCIRRKNLSDSTQ